MADNEEYNNEEVVNEEVNNNEEQAVEEEEQQQQQNDNNDTNEANEAYATEEAEQQNQPVEEKKEPEQPPPQQQKEQNYGSVEKPSTLKVAWDDLCKDNNTFNWFTAKPIDPKLKKPDLAIDTNGKGGLNEVVAYLKTQDDQIIFGLLRVNTFDDSNSVRAKFVFIKFMGTKVGFMKKAQLTPNLGKISENFPVKHLSKDLDETCHQFDPEHLSKDFLRFGGAHKPNRYEYGPDQVYNVKK